MRTRLTTVWLQGVFALLVGAVAILASAGAGGATPASRGSDRLLAWGSNQYGQLGDGTSTGPQSCSGHPCSTTPVKVKMPKGIKVVAMAAGQNHSLAVTSTGEVWSWGYNAFGQLGDGTTNSSDAPVKVKLPKGVKVVAVAAGGAHSLALTSTGRVLAWGLNADGELGIGTSTGPATCTGLACSTAPVKVKLPKGTKVVAVAAGLGHSLAVTSAGQVLAWGFNEQGELGVGESTGPEGCFENEPCSTIPVRSKLPKAAKAVAVAAGDYHSLAVTSAGQVLAWGFNRYGQLGDGTTTGPENCGTGISPCSTTPVRAKLPKGTKAVALAADGDAGLAATSTGTVFAWGYNSAGQLGDGSTTTRDVPVRVKLRKGTKVVAVAGGAAQNLARTSTGSLLAWGANGYGELGDGTYTGPDTCSTLGGPIGCSKTPVKVSVPKGDRATALGVGSLGDFSLAVVRPG